jgi:cell division protein FtsI/penicillin-binding protein 2
MTVAEIIKDSSNVGTVKIGIALGEEKLDEYIRRFGFGKQTGLGFPGESPGSMLDLEEWSGVTIGNLPIGQGLAVTPMQMAAAFSTIANRGVWVEPKLVFGTMDDQGGVERSPAARTREIVSRRAAREVRKMLTAVVEDGTGVNAQVPGYNVAGKTGTGQKALPTGGYGNSYVGSFAGFAPARHPELVAIVVLDEPRPIWGGHTAAPTFQKIMEFSLRHLGISPSGNAVQAAREIEQARALAGDVRD